MKDVTMLYMVRSWVDPDHGAPYLQWLESKHMAEVVAEPGIEWAWKIALNQTDDKGWNGYLLVYGVESTDALERYLNSAARERFWQELKPYETIHTSERFYGAIDFAIQAKSAIAP